MESSTEKTPEDIAFDEGFEACQRGKWLIRNPYDVETQTSLYSAWANGWMAAKENSNKIGL